MAVPAARSSGAAGAPRVPLALAVVALVWYAGWHSVDEESFAPADHVPRSLRDFPGGASEDAVARACKVYCDGPLLDAVQRAGLFEDSKTFVDMPMKQDPEEILEAFAKLEHPEDPVALRAFVEAHFLEEGHEHSLWTPPDFSEQPARLQAIENATMRQWALELNGLWKTLSRLQRPEYALQPQRHSALIRRYGVVIPGGRFRETYYWDTYFIVRGLIVCGMQETARGLVENLLDDVRNFGFVPNGGRIYYLDRSHPPLLTDMVLEVYRSAPDPKWLASVLPVLEQEYSFWMDPAGGHVVSVPGALGGPARGAASERLTLNIYRSASADPRPESYREDLRTFASARRGLGRAPADVFRSLRSAAETGWDFSSRWLATRMGGAADLATINTSSVVPVDLNSLLYMSEKGIAQIHRTLAGPGVEPSRAAEYEAAAARRRRAMGLLLWDAERGSFRDFCLDAGRPSRVVSVSDFAVPLWAGVPAGADALRLLEPLVRSSLLQKGGALTTTTFNSGEQWDAPNAFPPLQLMLIEGLDALRGRAAVAGELADSLTAACLHTFLLTWQRTHYMHEKYDALRPGFNGGGGEYKPQIGYAWSNAVALALLVRGKE